MRTSIRCILFLVILGGCRHSSPPEQARDRITLDSLAIVVGDSPRSYVFSDKRGGFFLGTLRDTSEQVGDHWSVNGKELLKGISLWIDTRLLTARDIVSATIYPDRAVSSYAGGTAALIGAVPLSGAEEHGHAILVHVRTSSGREIACDISPGADLVVSTSPDEKTRIWKMRNGAGSLCLYGGEEGMNMERRILVKNATEASFLVVFHWREQSEALVRKIYGHKDTLRQLNAKRMEDLINRSYFRSSDADLNKAVCWAKLMLDALVMEREDTFAVAGVPWDGVLYNRENAQSIAGLGLVTGNFRTTGAILRTLARWQDTVRTSTTFGRIADRVRNGTPTFGGADVGPWFFREMYEHVTYVNDTGLVRALYPLVRRGVEGTLNRHTDQQNFLVHGDDETWMYAPTAHASRDPERGRTETFAPRGNRAVEVQHLWYYQQLIASFVASFVGDTVSSKQWSRLAGTTESNFNKVFIDTASNLVFDHLNRDGAGVAEVRPNPLLGLEIIGSELVKQTMVKHIVANLVYPHGVGTLWSGDPRFRPSGRSENGPSIGRAVLNGPVWTALHGQLIYALTRYDRQDLGYLITRQMIRQILDRDMAGSLPEMFETAPRPGETVPRPAGLRASLPALAEFVRTVYQDYLGISVNAPANQVVLQPKLPDGITSVDFSVSAGANTILGRYELETVTSRMILWSRELDTPVRISFLWMLDNGDAWRGVAMLEGGRKLTIVFGADDLLAFQDEKEIEPVSKRKLKGFSQKAEFSGVEFAVPRWEKDAR